MVIQQQLDLETQNNNIKETGRNYIIQMLIIQKRAALAAKLKQQGIKGSLYMKWLQTAKPHKVREIKLHSFRAFAADAKKIINQNGDANLPMATKQQIMASAWNTVIITPAADILER
ncbi:MAG: hypothetical protein EZS28_056646 [Streblomastix strix]|uniref:Uncharacterized protein n=1 Tax=Streblomastix strix TaxID=222440 RepID=A0A5J4PJE0_9EUKA|nr:MAG: hypothetical protein EZS28_056646 [Streblomastix strix]